MLYGVRAESAERQGRITLKQRAHTENSSLSPLSPPLPPPHKTRRELVAVKLRYGTPPHKLGADLLPGKAPCPIIRTDALLDAADSCRG